MDNPQDDDRTIINVKGVRKPAWEKAKRGSAQTGESMGTWLSGAIEIRAIHDASGIQSPGNPLANPSLTPDQLTARIEAVAAYQQSVAALKMARARSIGNGALVAVQSSLEQHVIDVDGPPKRQIAGKARGQDRLILGDVRVIRNE